MNAEYKDFLGVSRDLPLPDSRLEQQYQNALEELATMNRFEDALEAVKQPTYADYKRLGFSFSRVDG